MSDYEKYRGKCLEACQALITANPELTLVRGHYFCPIWNVTEQHWWTVDQAGTINDPTRLQYPSKGYGIYTPFDGMIECAECGKMVAEENASIEGRYAFCSYRCHGRFVGIL